MNTYKTVRQFASDELVEKRSRFIGYCKPVSTQDEAIAFINEIKSKHWDARHNVYAYVIRSEGVSRYSDDGEPQGTAGIPVLDVIRKRGVTDCVIVVTRYFGGVLLGAGGLVRAYSAAAKLAVDASGEREMIVCSVCSLSCSYTMYGKLPSMIASFGGNIDDSSFTDDVHLVFHLPEDNLAAFNKALSEESSGKLQATEEEKQFFEKN
ncbi:YigZ family protein [uncultured Ruminococcus sp.]|uniref:YigZ family protein n=1 Tax=uncultured Ruminococcus sp. TaxID=165186 RepID=UPI0029303B29|nr:YigZ family protein [uncultured Ruminococcus sp.]